MGEATYYLKAYFPDGDSACEALPKVRALIAEGIEAHDWWQEHRKIVKKPEKDCSEFWKEFKQKFPLVTGYLAGAKGYLGVSILDGDCDNGLAGYLDFGFKDDIENLMQDGEVITYYAMVWHFATWDYFTVALEKLGASAVRWISDEYMDPFRCM